jgi:nucleotide-binding universal stress UspA family protein
MAYKTILVCLNEISRVPQLIAAVRQIGTKFNAHIAALYVVPGVTVYPSAGYGTGPDIFDGTRLYFQNHMPKVKDAFEMAMAQDKLSFDFHVVDSSQPTIAMDVIDNCHNADLVLVSNTNRDNAEGVESDFVERIVLAVGRPVLILPHKGEIKLVTDQILIAWNNSRESSRATFDAMPFLQKAKRTRIVSVDVAPRGSLPAASIAETLDRHGVKVEVTSISSDGMTVGQTLQRAANDYGAGLIVLGAYGHSRFAELIFGGATREVLRHLEHPVLMSH